MEALVAGGIFAISLALIMSEKMQRTIVAISGSAAMVIAGIAIGFYSEDEAIDAIDFETLGLLLGMMLDIFSALVIVVPLILPVAAGFGIDPIHLGMIFLANMQIGYCTPPVGMNLFIASYRFDKPIVLLYRAALPFLGILLLTVLIGLACVGFTAIWIRQRRA